MGRVEILLADGRSVSSCSKPRYSCSRGGTVNWLIQVSDDFGPARIGEMDSAGDFVNREPVPYDTGLTYRVHERGREDSRSLRHAFLSQWCITYCNTIQGRIH